MKTAIHHLATAACAALLLGSCTGESGLDGAARSTLQSRIEEELAAWSSDATPGAAVVVTHKGRLIAQHAVGMADLEHRVPITIDSVFHAARPVQYEVLGATALLTTARDLARWTEAVHEGTALAESELEMMLRPRQLPDGESMTYIFGLHQHEVGGRVAVGHGGADGGFRSYLLRMPEEQLGVAVLANTPEIEPNGLAHRIAEWALGIEPEPAEEGDGKPKEESFEPDVDTLVGSYSDGAGRSMTVRRWFDRLRLWESSTDSTDFTWSEEIGAFVDPDQRTFVCEGDQCRLAAGAEAWTGRRMADPSAEQLRQFEGLYRSEELGAAYSVSVHEDRLVARSVRGEEIELTPGGRDFFDGSTWFCNEARFLRAEDGAVRGLLLSSGRAFDVFFERQ